MQNPKQIFASTLKYLRYKHHFSQEKLVIQMQIRGSTITREVYKFIESGSGNIKVFDLVILKNIYRILYNFNYSLASNILKIYPGDEKEIKNSIDMNNFGTR